MSEVKYAPTSGEFLVSSSYDNKVKIWSSRSFGLIKTLEGSSLKIRLYFNPPTQKNAFLLCYLFDAGHEKLVMSIDVSKDESKIISWYVYFVYYDYDHITIINNNVSSFLLHRKLCYMLCIISNLFLFIRSGYDRTWKMWTMDDDWW